MKYFILYLPSLLLILGGLYYLLLYPKATFSTSFLAVVSISAGLEIASKMKYILKRK